MRLTVSNSIKNSKEVFELNWLDKVERKMRWFSIPNLMFLLSGMMLAVFLLEYAFPDESVAAYLYLNWDLIRAGEFWRILSFIILPPDSSAFFILFSLYLYCLIGNSLENQWGTCKFTLFYFTGIIGTIIGSLFTGYATNQYINLSLFLAFAAIYPNYTIMLFFVVPIKVKYLAVLDILLYIYLLTVVDWPQKIAILLSLANVLLFFSSDLWHNFKNYWSYRKTRRNFRENMRSR